jgi:hypothetical protein
MPDAGRNGKEHAMWIESRNKKVARVFERQRGRVPH